MAPVSARGSHKRTGVLADAAVAAVQEIEGILEIAVVAQKDMTDFGIGGKSLAAVVAAAFVVDTNVAVVGDVNVVGAAALIPVAALSNTLEHLEIE